MRAIYRTFVLLLVCAALLVGSCFSAHALAANIYHMTAQTFTASDGTVLPYRFYVPADYSPEVDYPVYIHLHGVGERGTDNNAQTTVGIELVKRVFARKPDDVIIIVPQCGAESQWVNCAFSQGTYNAVQLAVSPYLAALMELLRQVQKDYSTDEDRVYASGLSMGGYGVRRR